MSIDKKIEKILDKWEGTRMIEKHFGESEELLEELRDLMRKEFSSADELK